MRNRISFCLIAGGILIASLPYAGSAYQQHRQDLLYQSYLEDRTALGLTNQGAREETRAVIRQSDFLTRASLTGDQSNSAALISAAEGLAAGQNDRQKKEKEKPQVLGRIIIEKIGADLLLVEGAGAGPLNWGAGHITGTALPGEAGNCGIAAHRNYTFGSYFSRLGELTEGDEVTVDYFGRVLNYTVSEIKTVLPEDNTVLLPPEKGEILTLVTCSPKGSNSHRLILHCLPVETPDPVTVPGEASQPL